MNENDNDDIQILDNVLIVTTKSLSYIALVDIESIQMDYDEGKDLVNVRVFTSKWITETGYKRIEPEYIAEKIIPFWLKYKKGR